MHLGRCIALLIEDCPPVGIWSLPGKRPRLVAGRPSAWPPPPTSTMRVSGAPTLVHGDRPEEVLRISGLDVSPPITGEPQTLDPALSHQAPDSPLAAPVDASDLIDGEVLLACASHPAEEATGLPVPRAIMCAKLCRRLALYRDRRIVAIIIALRDIQRGR